MSVTVVVGLLAVTAGCSTGPAHTQTAGCAQERAHPRVLPPGSLSTVMVGNGGLTGVLAAARKPPSGQGALVGPHSVLQVDSAATVNSLTGEAVCRLDLPSPVTASPGYQLVLTDMTSAPDLSAPAPGLPACNPSLTENADCPSDASDTIVIGNATRPWPESNLNSSTLPGDTIVASVHVGTGAFLQLNDAGRPQDLDMRTGVRARIASPLYYPVPLQNNLLGADKEINFEFSPPGRDGNKPNWGLADVGLGPAGYAVLEPYNDTRKWAPAGRAWLAVSLPMKVDDDNNFALSYVCDVPQSFTLTVPGGGVVRAGGTAYFKESADEKNSANEVSLTFEVSAGFRAGTLSFTPTGTLTDEWTHASVTLANGQLDQNSHLGFVPGKLTLKL